MLLSILPRIGPIPLESIIIYLLGIGIHFWISCRVARTLDLERRVWIAVSICYLLSMIIVSKILGDIHHSHFNVTALFNIKNYLQWGRWGGLLGYFVLAVPTAWVLANRIKPALDLVALTIPIPWIVTKIVCLNNGCCYGRPSSLPWAISFPEGTRAILTGVPLHPTQIYEMIIMVIIIAIFKLLPSERWQGTLSLWFLCIYGFGRAAMDLFKGDFDRYIYIGPITLTQLICLSAAVLSAVLIILSRHKTFEK